MKARTLSRIVLGVSLSLGGLVLGYSGYREHQARKNSQYIRETVLENRIQAHEETLGITYHGKPKLSFETPEDWDPDRTSFALYDTKTNTIHIAQYFVYNSMSTMEPYIEELLDHELGHFYVDALNESMGKGDWPGYNEKITEAEVLKDLGIKLISEGIAEYFRKELNPEDDLLRLEHKLGGKREATDFQDSDWPKDVFDFFQRYVMYEGGHHLVKPIIDKHGKKGILYLMENPPTDLLDLPSYQKEVLKSLEN